MQRTWIAGGVAAVALLAWGGPALASAPHNSKDKPAPKRAPISITIDNQTREVSAGGNVRYTMKVRNQGTTAYRKAVVSQLIPSSLVYASAVPRADRATTSQVKWLVDLPAGKQVSLVMNGTVQAPVKATKATARRIATTACVSADSHSGLADCATDLDALAESPSPWRNPFLLAGLALVAIIGTVAAGRVIAVHRNSR